MVAQAPSAPTATTVAGRLSRAMLLIGALGLSIVLFILDRVTATWHVGTHLAGHTLTLIGVHLSYPAANASAIAVLGLAALGLAMTVRATVAAVREVTRSRRLTRRLALRRTGAPRADRLPPDVFVIEDPHPDAFVAGLLIPRVYITTAALALLDHRAAAAVLAHERHHAARRDPLRQAAARVLTTALFFLPSLKRLAEHELQLAELGADESALTEGRPALARALLAMEPHGGIDPVRVDRLLDECSGAGWLFPASLCAVAVGTLTLLGLTAALLARTASGTATLALPLLSRQPCIVTLAAVPAAITAILARCSRASAATSGGSSRTRARRSLRSR